MALAGRAIYGVAALAAAAVLASGVVLYWKIASREAASASSSNPHRADAAAGNPAQAAPAAGAPSMEVATEGLARRLKQQGGSADEWALLARSYVHLKRFPEAVDAFAKALELSPGDEALIAAQAAARQAAGMAPAR